MSEQTFETVTPETLLTAVDVRDQHHIPEILAFYMGKNTPDRRAYIMDNLVVDTEAV